jgi:hypothetical protein
VRILELRPFILISPCGAVGRDNAIKRRRIASRDRRHDGTGGNRAEHGLGDYVNKNAVIHVNGKQLFTLYTSPKWA